MCLIGKAARPEKMMTYETRIEIEIAGIRRGVRLAFEYHMEKADGARRIVHDAVTMLTERKRMPADWICLLLGPRQRNEINSRLLKNRKSATAARKQRRRP
jgi:hypothetical protein